MEYMQINELVNRRMNSRISGKMNKFSIRMNSQRQINELMNTFLQ